MFKLQADTAQIKKMWQNLKSKARDAKTLEAQCKRTGGGPPPPEMGPLESQVLSVMPDVMPTIDVQIDSDTTLGGNIILQKLIIINNSGKPTAGHRSHIMFSIVTI